MNEREFDGGDKQVEAVARKAPSGQTAEPGIWPPSRQR
jgi:hypothetical protein